MSDQFWTLYDFIETSGYPPFKRLIQNRLRERMAKLVQLHPQWGESDYANYFVNILNDDSQPETEKKLAHWHLLAYFDRDRCYLIWRTWCRLPFYAAYAENLYAVTNEHLCNRERLQLYLSKYNANSDRGASLKTYILGVLRNVTRDQINWESRWHLLCDVDINSCRKLQKAQARLREALQNIGKQEPEITQYLFAWQYFIPVYKNNRVYNPHRREGGKWQEPELSDFQETAQDYNAQRFQPGAPLQVAVGKDVTPVMIQKWLNICIDALQQSDQIIEVSYDPNTNEQPDAQSFNSSEAAENEEEKTESLQAVDLVLQTELALIEQNLTKIRSQIPPSYRQFVMPLCYPHRWALLTQEQFANKMSVHQGTVSRYISKYVEVPLIEKFQQLATEQFQPTDYIKNFLTEKFTDFKSTNPIAATLMTAMADLAPELQQVLKLKYGQKLNIIELTRTLIQDKIITQKEVEKKLNLAEHELQQNFVKLVHQWQANYVKSWLKTYYQNLIQAGLLNSFEELALVHKDILWQKYAQKTLKDNSHEQTITTAKQQLQRSFLQWIDKSFGLSLKAETQQIGEIIEEWLSINLLYQEIQRN